MQPADKKGMEEKGIAHVIAAFGYSMAGARVLLSEEAARLECVMMAVAMGLFIWKGASLSDYAILALLFMLVLSVEALNTAIEYIVDRTSPEISGYGKNVKDLGSFAVFCGLSVFCGFVLWVMFLG